MSSSTLFSGRYTRYELKLRPLTPIHVWSGTNAYVNVDAFVEGDDFYYLAGDIIDKLPASVLERILEISKKDHAKAMRIMFNSLREIGALAPVAKVRVKSGSLVGQQVKLLHRNLVPGSTLKGYIRTAILRSLLMQKHSDMATEIIKRGIDTSAKPAWVSAGLEAHLLKRPRIRSQGGSVDALELIMISDPRTKERKISLRELRVVYVNDPGRTVAKLLALTLDPMENDVLVYDLTINTSPARIDAIDRKRLKEEEVQFLVEVVKLKESFARMLSSKSFLLEAIREHGCRLIEIERGKIHHSLRDYVAFLDDIESRLCRKGLECAPARIGFMAGRESKTIIDIVQGYTPDVYNEVASLMSSSLKRIWDSMTLKLVDLDGKLVGVGWCELCIE